MTCLTSATEKCWAWIKKKPKKQLTPQQREKHWAAKWRKNSGNKWRCFSFSLSVSAHTLTLSALSGARVDRDPLIRFDRWTIGKSYCFWNDRENNHLVVLPNRGHRGPLRDCCIDGYNRLIGPRSDSVKLSILAQNYSILLLRLLSRKSLLCAHRVIGWLNPLLSHSYPLRAVLRGKNMQGDPFLVVT